MTYKQVLFRSAARGRVVRVGLENAVSVASVPLLTEATMTEIEEPRSYRRHPGDMEM
jgi:chaperonin GroEL